MSAPLLQLHTYHSPCADLLLGSYDDKLCLCDWLTSRRPGAALANVRRRLHAEIGYAVSDTVAAAVTQLDEYFSARRTAFDIPLLFLGTTFQTTVWHTLLEIPYGHTMSYSDLARLIGRPSAVRAVANANASNPISVFAPCHRVIGSDGSLTGYGGGLDIKLHLLRLESRNPASPI